MLKKYICEDQDGKKIPQDGIILTRANVLATLTKLHIFSQVWGKQFYGKILY